MGQSAAHNTWYDGGYRTQDGNNEPTCQKTGEDNSPAESYNNLQYIGEAAQIIDKGDEVDVQDVQGSDVVFRFFRTQKACEQFATQLHAKTKAQQDEAQKHLNPYE